MVKVDVKLNLDINLGVKDALQVLYNDYAERGSKLENVDEAVELVDVLDALSESAPQVFGEDEVLSVKAIFDSANASVCVEGEEIIKGFRNLIADGHENVFTSTIVEQKVPGLYLYYRSNSYDNQPMVKRMVREGEAAERMHVALVNLERNYSKVLNAEKNKVLVKKVNKQ